MLKRELDSAYLAWIGSPGEQLSVLDNLGDLAECKRRVAANATTSITTPAFSCERERTWIDLSRLREESALIGEQEAWCAVYLGERNNPYFAWLPAEFMRLHSESAMRDPDGKPVTLTDTAIAGGAPVLIPAVDDPSIFELARRCIREGVRIFANNPWVSSWVIGSEESWPEYFGLAPADFRAASLAHFHQWLALQGIRLTAPTAALSAEALSQDRSAWLRFRERAMADRAGSYMLAFLSEDGERPVFYPTHGHLFSLDKRWRLGQPPGAMVGSCDGLEMGHITFDDDSERLNMVALAHFSSFGAPLIVPRLGNKALDPAAKGGGGSFTPPMLRRLVYECLGMSAWHIGPIHWRSLLHDGEWFIKDTAAEKECGRVFREIQAARPILVRMARMQPEIGLYVSEESWRAEWNPRWTGFFLDSLSAHWNMTIVDDSALSTELARRIPLLVSIDNPTILPSAARAMNEYLDAGGRLASWGSFGDPREPLLDRVRTRVIEAAAGAPRTVVHEYLSADGSFKVPRTFASAPFPAMESAIASTWPAVMRAPAMLQGTGDVSTITNLALTDGVSVLFVVINSAASPVSIDLAPDPRLFRGDRKWGYLDAVRNMPLGGGARCALSLEPLATALVWMHPVVGEEETLAATLDAARAVSAWRDSGCDVAPLMKSLRLAEHPPDGMPAAKRWCLAHGILSSLSVRCGASQGPDGTLSVTAEPFDSSMAPVNGARVSFRLVPDRYRRHPLIEQEPGRYTLRLPAEDLPVSYDVDERRYRRVAGRVRMVLDAQTDAGAAGGSMQLIDLAG